MKRIALQGLAMIAALLISAEIGLRVAGALDFPLFRSDPRVGYVQRTAQSGAFLRRHHWTYNDRALGTDAPFRPTGLLLVGDSVVNGGNPLDQADKLGPVLQGRIGAPVWPLAAGGWALENEIQALKTNPDFLQVPTLVIVSNSGDFGALNAWSSPLSYPLERPPSALAYVAQKKILHPHDVVDSPVSAAATARWKADVSDLLARYHGRIVWVFYPKKAELGSRNRAFDELRTLLKGRAQLVDVATMSQWRPNAYRDSIHPTAQGDHVLSEIIADAVKSPRSDAIEKL